MPDKVRKHNLYRFSKFKSSKRDKKKKDDCKKGKK